MSVFFFSYFTPWTPESRWCCEAMVWGTTRSTCFWACRMLNFYCSCLFFLYCQRAVVGGASSSSTPLTSTLHFVSPQPLAIVSFALRLASADFYTFRLFPHVVSAAFPAWPLSVSRCFWLPLVRSVSFAVRPFRRTSLIFCGIFCPFFVCFAAHNFQRTAAGVSALSLAHRPVPWQSLSSFRLDSYYFAFKNRFAFVYMFVYVWAACPIDLWFL